MSAEQHHHGGPLFLRSLRAALGRAPLVLSIWVAFLLLALAAALPWSGALAGAIDHRYEPGALVATLDETFRADHRALLGGLEESTAATGAVLALLAMLLGAFVAGGWLQVFLERTHGQSVRRFFLGGARYFFRFFRLMLLTLLVLQLVGWIVYGAPWMRGVEEVLFGVPDSDYTVLRSEMTAANLIWAQASLYAVLFALVMTWGDYTRTRLALHDTTSAVWAGICSVFLILRHPLKTLRPMVGLLLFEIVLLLGAASVGRALGERLSDQSTRLDVLSVFLVGQVALAVSIVVRGARYHAAVQVSRDIVRPISRPDPWKETVGGPGGPRYPIGGDEYGVAL